jgi:hypothetical protein
MSQEELKFISENGAVVDMDHKKPGDVKSGGPKLHYIKQLLTNRMMFGVFFGQYFINTITWFFLTVPDLPGTGKRHVDPESRSGGVDSCAVRICRWRARRCVL